MKRDEQPDPLPPVPANPKPSRPPCPDFAALIKKSTPDRSLFEQIASCFADTLEDFARYYCRNDALGQDAFQDAMIATMTHFDTFRGDSPLEPWLKRIVVSACSRLRRGRKNDPALHQPFDEGLSNEVRATQRLTAAESGQELQVILAEQLKRMREKIERLKEPNRTLLVLHDIEEVPIAELAKRYHMSEESVKSRLKRSRAWLRDQLVAFVP